MRIACGRNSNAGFISVAALVLILAMLALVVFAFYKSLNQGKTQLNLPGSSTIQSNPASKQSVPLGWQIFNFRYGQIAVPYPANLFVKYVFSRSSTTQYADFFWTKDKQVTTGEYVISVSVHAVGDYDKLDQTQLNFNIPALGSTNNALFSQLQDRTEIRFLKDGISYILSANIYEANKQKLDPIEINSILSNMAKNINFTNEQSSCEEPILRPVKGFPDSFALSNRHDSDGQDEIVGYWPNTTFNFSEQTTPNTNPPYTIRGFIVTYVKDGQSFSDSGDFSKTVVAISGSRDNYSTDQTVLLNVNCVDHWVKDNYYQPYAISENKTDLFAIAIYGSSDNPQKLWPVVKWNADLLKKTRNTVYVKMDNMWQKYTAKSYFVTSY